MSRQDKRVSQYVVLKKGKRVTCDILPLQTRVILREIDERDASDYINANVVMGYRDRKRWICAQGPLEHTVADFWRMIYEQVLQ